MFIANPIYDVFFKYLLEDEEIAKELIGAFEERRKKASIENEIEGSFKKMAREIQEKDVLIEESKRAIEEKEKAIQEKNAVIYSVVKLLKESGVSLQDISLKTGLSLDEILKII